jgi:hypothetical protein
LPPAIPDILLSSDADTTGVNEGSSVTFDLVSSNGAADAGKTFAYNLGGSDATPAHIGNIPLSGTITLDAQGVGKLTVGVLNDNVTDGPQTLSLSVNGQTDIVNVNDTSRGPNFTLTVAQDSFTSGTGNDLYSAPLAGIFGNQPTLTVGDKLVATGLNNELDASFNGSSTVTGLTIQGIQTLAISQFGGGSVSLQGVPGSIDGVTSLSFNGNGLNAENLTVGSVGAGIDKTTPANGFVLNISNVASTPVTGVVSVFFDKKFV